MLQYCTNFNVDGGLSGHHRSQVATKVGGWAKTVSPAQPKTTTAISNEIQTAMEDVAISLTQIQ